MNGMLRAARVKQLGRRNGPQKNKLALITNPKGCPDFLFRDFKSVKVCEAISTLNEVECLSDLIGLHGILDQISPYHWYKCCYYYLPFSFTTAFIITMTPITQLFLCPFVCTEFLVFLLLLLLLLFGDLQGHDFPHFLLGNVRTDSPSLLLLIPQLCLSLLLYPCCYYWFHYWYKCCYYYSGINVVIITYLLASRLLLLSR
jgi:hypothetical protein